MAPKRSIPSGCGTQVWESGVSTQVDVFLLALAEDPTTREWRIDAKPAPSRVDYSDSQQAQAGLVRLKAENSAGLFPWERPLPSSWKGNPRSGPCLTGSFSSMQHLRSSMPTSC